ncbi:MAG: NAD(P)/FAD-dependent oxidoreductase [Jatrophihabitantaceae bacterium]
MTDADLVIVGGGVMGLFTAYHASGAGARVAVLEAGRIGDPRTASYGRTRSYRRDYLDARYVRLADEAMRLWDGFERDCEVRALVRCGCMNIATEAVSPDLADTYGRRSAATMRALGIECETLDAGRLKERFGYLRADEAHLDAAAGLIDLAAVTGALVRVLAGRGVAVHENVEVTRVVAGADDVRVGIGTGGELTARALVITAGHGTNGILRRVDGCELQIPLTRDRPAEARYYVPEPAEREQFTADAMPVIAYLDTGVYVHPIVDGVVDAVKIGYYDPPDLPRGRTGVENIAEFVEQCLPGLLGARARDVLDVDQCDYDLVADDHFVLGPVPGSPGVTVGVGWRGTGYKFAPWVGRVLHELALRRGTVYDIAAFDPARFARADQLFRTDEVH